MAKKLEIKFVCGLQSVTMKRAGKDEIVFINLELDQKQVGAVSDLIKNEDLLKITIDDQVVFGAVMTTCKAGKTDQPKFKNIDLKPTDVQYLCERVKKESEISVLIEIDSEGLFAFVEDEPQDNEDSDDE